jgi:hypothetical protein
LRGDLDLGGVVVQQVGVGSATCELARQFEADAASGTSDQCGAAAEIEADIGQESTP